MSILNGAWWKAAIMRALRTAAVIALPYVPISLNGGDYLILVSVAAMGALLSILTSLTGIAEVDGIEEPWYFSLLSRVVKTTAQALVTAVGAAVLITDVNWNSIPALVVTAIVGSSLLFFTKGVPETNFLTSAPVAVAEVEESGPIVTEAAVEADANIARG